MLSEDTSQPQIDTRLITNCLEMYIHSQARPIAITKAIHESLKMPFPTDPLKPGSGYRRRTLSPEDGNCPQNMGTDPRRRVMSQEDRDVWYPFPTPFCPTAALACATDWRHGQSVLPERGFSPNTVSAVLKSACLKPSCNNTDRHTDRVRDRERERESERAREREREIHFFHACVPR